MRFDSPAAVMRRALELARRGLGAVEPNPPVGAVVVDDELTLLGEGWHERFGGPHAEVHALREAGSRARGATLFVTLEPCCHHGKTPPCTQAVISAGIRRVVAAAVDPNQLVGGKGLAELSAAGVAVDVGLLQAEAELLIAPFRKLVVEGRPWTIAKWAMTLDGKLATFTGDSRWISGCGSRQIVHGLRGRMDAVVVGIGTVLADDPQLTARPPGPRVPARVVVDSQARLPENSKLVATVPEAPVLAAVSRAAPPDRVARLMERGIEVVSLPEDDHGRVLLTALWKEFGRRRFTNVLVEGGRRLFGALFDLRLVDEVYSFVAPKLIGGESAPTPVGGAGIAVMEDALRLDDVEVRLVEGDVLIRGRVAGTEAIMSAEREARNQGQILTADDAGHRK
jgi:diaminohydroxyphosphoribosylaminopyrimidine deaminase/5-amino-6-(5-phosphoribosylamino)uracil reductase